MLMETSRLLENKTQTEQVKLAILWRRFINDETKISQ